MKLEAFAKINWSLDITGIREDGYHFMDMLMQPVSLADQIELAPADVISITTGGYPPVRADERNLAFRAAQILKSSSCYPGGASIHIEKHIPVGAGMGGGSTDAAAVLIGLNRLWNTGLSAVELEKIGLSLGADVPFFIRGGLTRTRGIGDLLESHDFMHSYRLIIIQPCSGLSTAQVFNAWHDDQCLKHPDTLSALHALETGNLLKLCASLENVLQPVSSILRPEIDIACKALISEGALTAKMTGSGSAVFGVFRSGTQTEKAFLRLSSVYKTVFSCHTQHDSIRIIQE